MTDVAGEGLLTGVGAQVGGQVGCLGEGFGAFVAFVGLLAVVGAHVGLEGGRTGIGFVADSAAVHAIVCWVVGVLVGVVVVVVPVKLWN